MGWDRALPQRGPSGLRRHGLNTRAKRLGLVAGYADHPSPSPGGPSPSGTWRWNALVSSFRWTASSSGGSPASPGPCGSTRPSTWPPPTAGQSSTSPPGTLRPVVLGAGPEGGPGPLPTGWRLEAGMSGQRPGVPLGGVRGHRGSPGRPPPVHSGREAQTNGWWERVLRTILEECWKPAFARYLIPKYTGLRLDLYR